MPVISDNIKDITKPRFVDGQFYAPFQNSVANSDLINILPDVIRKKLEMEKAKGLDDGTAKNRDFSNVEGKTTGQTGTIVNKENYENDIWRQAAYKGYFDGEWHNDEDKVLKFSDVLLDEAKLNGGLNLRDLQNNKVKRELFETLVLNEAGKDDNLVNDLADLYALAHYNNWGDINPFNVTPEQLEALIEYYKTTPKLSNGQRPIVRGIGEVLPIVFNLIKAIFGARG